MRLQIKGEILDRIDESPIVIGKIADVLKRHYTSIYPLIKRNDPQLTQKAVLLLLSQEFDLSEEELLEEVPEQLAETNS